MKVMVIGSGGREHTLIWKLSLSSKVKEIYAAPGNGGISKTAKCVDISADDIDGQIKFVKENNIDLTIVGPEDPLSKGIVDRFMEHDLKIFGPTKSAARLESSKSFAKDMMRKFNIPTADYKVFDDSQAAVDYIKSKGAPIVIKADGLAAGKGVIPCLTEQEALDAIRNIMDKRSFGDAGNKVVIEDYLEGEEASILAFSDGSTVIPMASSQDHKRIFDGDKGPNTGGMGAYSPAPVVTEHLGNEIYCKILVPIIEGMKESGIEYRGVLYAGLMITDSGPQVVEFNCRFGDPELQVVLPRMKSDLVDPVVACINGNLSDVRLDWDHRPAVCVVIASGGYPGKYDKGKDIKGLDSLDGVEDVIPFHAGTKIQNGGFVTSGGRVIGITALDNDIPSAIDKAYSAVDKINFEGSYYRKDIGHLALKRKDSI